MQGNQITFEEVCALAGRLFLESQHEIRLSVAQNEEQRLRAEKAERERDELVVLLTKQKETHRAVGP